LFWIPPSPSLPAFFFFCFFLIDFSPRFYFIKIFYNTSCSATIFSFFLFFSSSSDIHNVVLDDTILYYCLIPYEKFLMYISFL
jgi:hypothetical protein